MRGLVGILFMLYVAAAAMSLSLGRCGPEIAEAEELETDYCAIGVVLPE